MPGGGLLIGLSVGFAALGSALAFIIKSLAGVHPLTILAGIVAALLMVVLPLMIVAVAKLRRQDVSVLLEGCGWAVNARMRLDRRQRRHFTHPGPYPPGAKGTPRDGRWRWLFWMSLLALLLAGAGAVYFAHHAPEAIPAPPPPP
jgi:hypothetical protein